MNARPNFIPGLGHVARDMGTAADEKMLAAACGSVGSYELAEGRAIEIIGQCEKFAADLAKRMGTTDARSVLIGALQGQIKALCQEADAAGLPPTALSELTVKGEGDIEYTVRYEVDLYGDVEMREVYSRDNLLGALADDHMGVIEDELTKLHLKGLREDADEAVIAAGRARLDALAHLPGRNEP